MLGDAGGPRARHALLCVLSGLAALGLCLRSLLAVPLRLRAVLRAPRDVRARMRWWAEGGAPLPPTDRYLLFSMDIGGLNNVRLAWEMTGLVAQLTGRTLVLPPPDVISHLDVGVNASDLPSSMRNRSTVTAIEDLINVRQLKAHLPTLSWEEFRARTGLTRDEALDRAASLQNKSFDRCEQIAEYERVPDRLLFMSGDNPRREGFYCSEWNLGGAPRPALRRRAGAAGEALLREGFLWHEDAFDIAAVVVEHLGLFGYVAAHVRYGDFRLAYRDVLRSPEQALEALEPWLRSRTLYIATDEPQRFAGLAAAARAGRPRVLAWPDLLGNTTGGLLAAARQRFDEERWFKLTGLVEQLICTFAEIFVGTSLSTFSGYIQTMRRRAGAPVARELALLHGPPWRAQDIEAEARAHRRQRALGRGQGLLQGRWLEELLHGLARA